MKKNYPFHLQPLPYRYDVLMPHISEQTLGFHHDKHLQTYVDNLNKILEPYPELHDWSLEKLLLKLAQLPDNIQIPVKNNAGGVYNHELYFNCMTNSDKHEPEGALADAINQSFGSFDAWKEEMKNAALTQFGSGYAWLVLGEGGKLCIHKTLNQDTPLSCCVKPLLLVDVWEHAYYLDYQNRRAEYLDNWFDVIDWNKVEETYNQAKNS